MRFAIVFSFICLIGAASCSPINKKRQASFSYTTVSNSKNGVYTNGVGSGKQWAVGNRNPTPQQQGHQYRYNNGYQQQQQQQQQSGYNAYYNANRPSNANQYNNGNQYGSSSYGHSDYAANQYGQASAYGPSSSSSPFGYNNQAFKQSSNPSSNVDSNFMRPASSYNNNRRPPLSPTSLNEYGRPNRQTLPSLLGKTTRAYSTARNYYWYDPFYNPMQQRPDYSGIETTTLNTLLFPTPSYTTPSPPNQFGNNQYHANNQQYNQANTNQNPNGYNKPNSWNNNNYNPNSHYNPNLPGSGSAYGLYNYYGFTTRYPSIHVVTHPNIADTYSKSFNPYYGQTTATTPATPQNLWYSRYADLNYPINAIPDSNYRNWKK